MSGLFRASRIRIKLYREKMRATYMIGRTANFNPTERVMKMMATMLESAVQRILETSIIRFASSGRGFFAAMK